MTKSLLVDYTAFHISPDIIAESERENNGKVVVTGVLHGFYSKLFRHLNKKEDSQHYHLLK